jgi:hypothetical protein
MSLNRQRAERNDLNLNGAHSTFVEEPSEIDGVTW